VKPFVLLIAGIVLLSGVVPMSLPSWPEAKPVVPAAPGPASAAVYVYEKDASTVPVGVTAGLNRLNRERQITATLLEADTTDGTGDVPEQYRPALDAGKAAGLPAFVVLSGSAVIAVKRAPESEDDIVRAVP
jgi:hypothetical protein